MPRTTAAGFWLATLATLAWIGYCVWANHSGLELLAAPLPAPTGIAVLAAPVAAFYAIAAVLGRSLPPPTLAAPDSLEEAESRLAGVAGRLQSLRAALHSDLESIARATAALDQRAPALHSLLGELTGTADAARQAHAAFATILPDASRTGDALIAVFAETADRAGREADRLQSATRGLASELDGLERQGAATASALGDARAQSEAGMRAIRSEADSLFEVLEGTLVAKQRSLLGGSNALIANLTERYGEFHALAEKSLGEFSRQLGDLADATSAIDRRLQQALSATAALGERGADTFRQLDQGLDSSRTASEACLSALTSAAESVAATLQGLQTPAAAAQQATQALSAQLDGVTQQLSAIDATLGGKLTEGTAHASEAIGGLTQQANSVRQSIAEADTAIAALTAPIAERMAELAAAAAAYGAQKAAIESAGQSLVAQLQQAGQLIADVDRQTRDTSVAAAAELVDTFNQIRSMSTQATGTLRESIDGLVAEAQTALQQAADDALRHGFAEPIARYAADAETHAAAAAERTATSMTALAEALQLIEARIARSRGQLAAADQQNLGEISAHLLHDLGEAGISIAAALDKPMSDADWQLWQKGERGFFSRRAHALLARRDLGEISRLLQGNDRFAQAARTYVAAFEHLVERFSESVPSLSAALRGSEQGRLAALLGEAMDYTGA